MYEEKEPYEREEKDWHTSLPKRPTVVCLCGSTRFKAAFEAAALSEMLAGRITLQPGHYTHAEAPAEFKSGDKETYFGPEVAQQLEELYKRKIEMADEILVLNVGGYIGSSTQREIEYAAALDKRISYLEKPLRQADNYSTDYDEINEHGSHS